MSAFLRWYFERLRFWLIIIIGMAACAISARVVGWLFSDIFGRVSAETYFVVPLSFCGFLIVGALAVERSEWLHRLLFFKSGSMKMKSEAPDLPETKSVSWRRGFFRLWLVSSLLWVSLLAWIGYQRFVQLSCFDARKATPSLGNPYECLPSTGYPDFDYLLPNTATVIDFVAMALAPTVCVLIAGLIAAWIAAGFGRRAT
jgi:hypothetical protein